MTVAALYVDTRGVYPALLGPEYCWGETRDARTYAGPWPVVAHPPCGPYGRLRHLSRKQDPSCGPRAVDQVRAHGGVLEHPADSRLFDLCAMPRPGELPDAFGGRTYLVDQCDFGHVARKRTWLYVVRAQPGPMPPKREPTHWVSGGRGRVGKKPHTTPVPPGIKVCSAQQRRRTPLAFAKWIVSIAEQAVRP